MKFLVLIPARYESSRFPGKPLALIGGEPMIIRVCKQVRKTGFPLAVATDNDKIAKVVEEAGFRAIMTNSSHKSGTERIEEAFQKIGERADVVINVQGDEPFIDPNQIKAVAELFINNPNTDISTLVRPFDSERGIKDLEDPNLVKVAISETGKALYFSRSVIPYIRKYPKKEWTSKHQFYTHIGIYAYRAEVLKEIVLLPESDLEKAESLEQLRWLQNGKSIFVSVSEIPTIGIDTPEDLASAEEYLLKNSK